MQNTCDICYKIICKKCGWEARGEQILLIQEEIITKCPACGWSPKEEIKKN